MTPSKHLDNLLTLGHQQASSHGSRSDTAFNTYKEGLDLEFFNKRSGKPINCGRI